jgi:1-acyl-sn-glycerol-3-phosphate acyltransferase
MRHLDLDDLEQRDPERVRLLVALTDRVLKPYFRAEVRGLERIPEGPGLYVGNHNAGLLTPDTFLFGAAVYHARGLVDVPYGLGHEVALALPGINQLVVPLGGVRASHRNAHRLFAAGRKVLVYPGGDVEAMRPYRHRDRVVFDGRTGYLKLALREAVPIVPVVAAGAHATFRILDDGRWLARWLRADCLLRIKVWPLTLCLPWGLVVGPGLFYLPWPTKILVEVLEPLRFERTGDAAAADEGYVRACADRVEGAMQAALTRLAREREASRT